VSSLASRLAVFSVSVYFSHVILFLKDLTQSGKEGRERTVNAELSGVEEARLALPGGVGDDDASNAEVLLFGLEV
jgi:hypothetical protein